MLIYIYQPRHIFNVNIWDIIKIVPSCSFLFIHVTLGNIFNRLVKRNTTLTNYVFYQSFNVSFSLIIIIHFYEYEYQYYLPTRSNSLADGFVDRKRDQMSIVKIVDAELKIDVNEEIRAANITASIIPRKPIQLYWIKNLDSGFSYSI